MSLSDCLIDLARILGAVGLLFGPSRYLALRKRCSKIRALVLSFSSPEMPRKIRIDLE